jgi:hypothetical protein
VLKITNQATIFAFRANISFMLFGRSARFLSALALSVFLPLIIQAQGPQADTKSPSPNTSASGVPVLVELFTSEGCSSCPPADVILQRLDSFQPIQGAQLIVLSEHVTYWDQLGWKDPNSSPAFTDRQSAYESKLGIPEPYTPQFVIDGDQSVSLDKVQALEDALNKAKAEPKISVRIVSVTVDPANPTLLKTHIETDANADKHNADVYVAVVLDHVESQVLRGENGGKHLVHVAVVQQLSKVGKLSKGKAFAEDVQLKLKPGDDPKNLRLVAFVQESGPGRLLGASMRKSVQ